MAKMNIIALEKAPRAGWGNQYPNYRLRFGPARDLVVGL
jgi:hypothetical protein